MNCRPTKAFEAANRYLGWGEPQDGVWFVGLEESKGWEGSDEAKVVRSYGGLKYSPPELHYDWAELKSAGKPIRDTTPKILQPLSLRGEGPSWRGYRDQYLWTPGSLTFQANLFPIGKRSRQLWPNDFKKLFGFGRGDKQEYEAYVAKTRFKEIGKLWTESRPQATICFGRECWDCFRSIFAESNETCVRISDKIHVYPKTRLILTYFFARSWVTDEDVKKIIKVLKNWGIAIP